MSKSEKKLNFGQSLVEVVIALTVLAIVLTGLVRTVTVSQKNMRYSRNKNFGLLLVRKKIEALRQERDSQPWGVFWGNYFEGASPRQPTSETNLNEAGVSVTGGIFTRLTTFVNLSALEKNKMKADVEVSWPDGQETFSTSSTIILTKWID